MLQVVLQPRHPGGRALAEPEHESFMIGSAASISPPNTRSAARILVEQVTKLPVLLLRAASAAVCASCVRPFHYGHLACFWRYAFGKLPCIFRLAGELRRPGMPAAFSARTAVVRPL